MVGKLILVVGPSGAGKDSLIAAAKRYFAGNEKISFPRRVITRPPSPAAEDHDTLSNEDFVKALQQGAFFMHWHAHELSYGLPISLADDLDAGKTVIVNVSRTVLAQAEKAWPHSTVLEITAPPQILAQRVTARARGEDGDVQKRISRTVEAAPDHLPRITISNDKSLAEAEVAFCAVLEKLITDKGTA